MSIETKTVTFEDVQKEIDRIPDINYGGCGIAALAMARWIKKYNHNRMTSLFVMGHNNVDAFKLNADVLAKVIKQKPTAAEHIGLIVYDRITKKQMIVDCNSVYDMTRYDYVNTFRDEKLLLDSINRVDHWNPVFDRNHVTTIAQALNIDLSDVDCRTKKKFQDDEIAETSAPITMKAKYLKKFLRLIKH